MKLPVKRPTACTFGGEQLEHLYVTTRVETGAGVIGLAERQAVDCLIICRQGARRALAVQTHRLKVELAVCGSFVEGCTACMLRAAGHAVVQGRGPRHTTAASSASPFLASKAWQLHIGSHSD